jgi:hypothetical protein
MAQKFPTKCYLHITMAQVTRRIRFFMNLENLKCQGNKILQDIGYTRLQCHNTWQKPFLVFRLHGDSGYIGKVCLFRRLLTARVCTSACNACNRGAEARFRNCMDLTDYRLHSPVSRPSCICRPSHISIVPHHLTRHAASFRWRPEPLLHWC